MAALFAELSGQVYWLSPGHIIGILAVILFLQGLLNTFNVRLVALLNDVSVYWHLIGVAIIVILLYWGPASGSTHNSASFMFGSEGWNAFKGLSGFTAPLYIVALGMLNAQYTFTGYDASAHVSEETINANIQAAKGIVRSIWVSLIAGFILLVGISYAIPNFSHPISFAGTTVKSYSELAVLYPNWAVTFISSAGRDAALVLIVIVGVAQFFCGMSSVTANSRMIYAFSRDGAVPGHNFWHHVSKKRRVPVRSAWFGAVGAFIISVPYMWNYTAYNAVVATAVIGLYIAYLMPVFLRRINPKAFVPGPYVLNKTVSMVIGWIAIVWVIFICIVFLLPPYSPITRTNFNYSIVVVLAVIGFALIWWLAGARKWFKGPKIQGTAEELAAIEADLTQFDTIADPRSCEEVLTRRPGQRSGGRRGSAALPFVSRPGRAQRPAPAPSWQAAPCGRLPVAPARGGGLPGPAHARGMPGRTAHRLTARQPGASELRCALWSECVQLSDSLFTFSRTTEPILEEEQ